MKNNALGAEKLLDCFKNVSKILEIGFLHFAEKNCGDVTQEIEPQCPEYLAFQ